MKRFINMILALLLTLPAYGMQRAVPAAVSLSVPGTVGHFERALDRAISRSQSSTSSKRKREIAVAEEPSTVAPAAIPRIAGQLLHAVLSRAYSAPSLASLPRTILGQRSVWKLPAYDNERVNRIMSTYHVNIHVAHTLFARGYTDDAAIERATLGLLERDIPHAALLKDAPKAIDRILKAIEAGEKILVCGDYDVDGMTSSALLMRCLSEQGARVDFKIPHRVRDGYGLKVSTIEKAAQDGVTVVITVDNGITAFEPARRAKQLGIDLIVTDHHLAHGEVPDAYAIVNPNQPGCTYPNKGLAGIGVAFKLMTLLYEKKQCPLPDKAFELMMLGTIADVVPLTPENRYWVRYGLDLVNNGRASASFKKLCSNNPGLKEKPRINSIDIAFCVAPQLNAVGRLEDANQGVVFLLDQSSDETEALGDLLCELNNRRKKIQSDMFDSVKARIQAHEVSLKDDRVIMLSDPDWHPGINGLVASKVVERYYKPTILFREITDENGEIILKGSGRSTAWFDLFKALDNCKDLLITFGGHVCAAGVALKKSNFEEFKVRMQEVFMQRVPRRNTVSRRVIDSPVSFDELTDGLIHDFEALEPFGSDNPQPTLLFRDVCVAGKPSFIGRKHVKCLLKSGGAERTVKFFFRPDMFYRLQEMGEQPFNLIGNPSSSYWNGVHEVEIYGVDIERTSGAAPIAPPAV